MILSNLFDWSELWNSLRESIAVPNVWAMTATIVYFLGIFHALHAIMKVRLSQSAIAWSVFLLSMPWLGIPVYWIFGRRKFEGYTDRMRSVKNRYDRDQSDLVALLHPWRPVFSEPLRTLDTAALQLGSLPFSFGNQVDLLIDGQQTYPAILGDIAEAKDYILFQTYILNDDKTGREFLTALGNAVRRGARVHLLYDEVGSNSLTSRYLRQAEKLGIVTSGFKSTKGRGNRFQINFRNHRKIIVIDGKVGFIGGLNIGDEHLGLDRSIGHWRDTHIRVSGPAVKALQYSFLSDWYWAMDYVPATSWDFTQLPKHHNGKSNSNSIGDSERGDEVLILPNGPNDKVEVCSLFIGSLIDIARKRIWIATPYFVPDEPTLSALKIASLRGVEVRLIVPRKVDHLALRLCTLSYYEDLNHLGIKVYEYLPGFMHQKVILIDDLVAGVGTVNMDNRSFHLNFEAMAYVASARFVASVEAMLIKDISHSVVADLETFEKQKLPMRLLIRIARLFSAIL
jgi:cardiolipin synthase